MMMPGTPEKENPSTLKSHWQCRPTWNHTPGIDGAKCGSFSKIGLPVAVRFPDMTKELEPRSGRAGPMRAATRAIAAVTPEGTGSGSHDAGVAGRAMKAPPFTEPAA